MLGRLINPMAFRALSRTCRPVRFKLVGTNCGCSAFVKHSFQVRWFSDKKDLDKREKSIENKPGRIEATVKRELPPPVAPPKPSIYTIPNILTMTRIATAPFIGYFIVKGDTTIALVLFSYSCITDFIDGYIARKWNMKSVVGSIIDPLADKFLMTVCTLSLAYINSIPALVATLIIGRDVMLSCMSFYYRYKTIPPPKTWGKFLNIAKNETISVHPNMLGKVNTGLQMLYLGGLVFKPVVEVLILTDMDVFFQGMGILVGTTTVLSGLSYVFNNSSVRYLKK